MITLLHIGIITLGISVWALFMVLIWSIIEALVKDTIRSWKDEEDS